MRIARPLATKFSIRQGRVWFQLPYVKTRDDYIVVLMGDSGNASHMFTILAHKER